MMIVAQQGSDTYLLAKNDQDQTQPGQIYDRHGRVLYEATNSIGAILARGYWEPYDGPQDIFDDDLKKAIQTGWDGRPIAKHKQQEANILDLIAEKLVEKHLPGQHDQSSHGRRSDIPSIGGKWVEGVLDLEPKPGESTYVYGKGVSEEIKTMFGKDVSIPKLLNAIGIVHPSNVRVNLLDRKIEIISHGPFGMQDRLLFERSYGIALYMNSMVIDTRFRKHGLATKMLARIVDKAPKLGIKRLLTFAIDGLDRNGYYTWPRLGYDGDIPLHLRYRLPSGLKNAKRISDLMKSPEGRKWWKERKESIDVEFDLAPGSISRRVFDAYRKEKGI